MIWKDIILLIRDIRWLQLTHIDIAIYELVISLKVK